MNRIFVINTGSTSTKIAVFEGDKKTFEANLIHSADELGACSALLDQYPMRKKRILTALAEAEVEPGGFSAIAARGGTFGYAKSGAYLIEENLLKACKNPVTNHPSNLSAIIAYDIARFSGCDAYIYDAVCVNEIEDIARVTGLSDVKRRPFSHVLNTRAVAKDVARTMGREYEDMNIIAAHLGGGISINLHRHGRIVDLVCDDEGPMSPERAGRLNGKAYVDMCYSGKYTKDEMMLRIKGHGGLIDHLGTSDLIEVEKRITAGDKKAEFVLNAMAYEIAKDIAALSAVVYGKVDRIILTGGAAYSKRLTDLIRSRVEFLVPVAVIPGGKEMEALADGVARVLSGDIKARVFGLEA